MFGIVNSSEYIKESVLWIANLINTNVTDPISAKRASNEKFVYTSYPKRNTKYPIITIRHLGTSDVGRLGMRSELHYINVPLEIRIWARNEKEKDELTVDVMNVLRTNQFGANSASDTEELHDFMIMSNVMVDEDGETGILSSVIEIRYRFILGAS